MKKTILILICFTILATMVSCNKSNGTDLENIDITNSDTNIQTAEFTQETEILSKSQGLELVSNGDGTCYVAGIGSCTDKNIVFPQYSPDGDIVTSIANHAFYALNNIESVVVSNGITQIGAYAFSECTNLVTVTISDSVVVIGSAAFSGCKNLNSVDMSRNVINISEYMFSHCQSLTSIIIPQSVKSISYKAFEKCFNLESIAIPSGVYKIESYAFMGCEKLTSMVIPYSVINIGGGIFAGCKSLKTIEVEQENPYYISKDNCIIQKYEKKLIGVCNDFNIPTDIVSIGEDVISQLDIEKIIIPKSIIEMEFAAITGCHALKSILFKGTINEWELIEKNSHWFLNNSDCYIYCIDGIVSAAP